MSIIIVFFFFAQNWTICLSWYHDAHGVFIWVNHKRCHDLTKIAFANLRWQRLGPHACPNAINSGRFNKAQDFAKFAFVPMINQIAYSSAFYTAHFFSQLPEIHPIPDDVGNESTLFTTWNGKSRDLHHRARSYLWDSKDEMILALGFWWNLQHSSTQNMRLFYCYDKVPKIVKRVDLPAPIYLKNDEISSMKIIFFLSAILRLGQMRSAIPPLPPSNSDINQYVITKNHGAVQTEGRQPSTNQPEERQATEEILTIGTKRPSGQLISEMR